MAAGVALELHKVSTCRIQFTFHLKHGFLQVLFSGIHCLCCLIHNAT